MQIFWRRLVFFSGFSVLFFKHRNFLIFLLRLSLSHQPGADGFALWPLLCSAQLLDASLLTPDDRLGDGQEWREEEREGQKQKDFQCLSLALG